jgi:two-component system response regulator NreC
MISPGQTQQGRGSRVTDAPERRTAGTLVTRLKVILVDDHVEILQRVERLLASNFDVVEKCSSSETALQAVEQMQPDVVVLDISMPPGLSGIELARMIRQRTAKPRFVYLTQHEDAGLAQAVREEGGYAYVVKRLVATDLVPAIEAVMEGKSFVSEFVS